MTDTDTNPGVRGQTRSTWRDETHLRGLLLRLVTKHPDASREQLEAWYLDKAEMVPALIEEALRRAFDNDYAQMQKSARPRTPRPVASEIQAAKTAKEIAATVERIKTIVLLDLVQPNGKKLRDCTGADLRTLEAQMPAWFKALAVKVKVDQIVGEVLTEADVRKAAPKEWSAATSV